MSNNFLSIPHRRGQVSISLTIQNIKRKSKIFAFSIIVRIRLNLKISLDQKYYEQFFSNTKENTANAIYILDTAKVYTT